MFKTHPGDEREDHVCTHPYATRSCNSRGRVKELENDGIRTEFQRDIHRITYSLPFRRLRHKTQVFYMPKSDHICNRLEHSFLVASAARTIARALRLNEDLAEAIGLGHDLGHAPFGHHGESILGELCIEHELSTAFHHEINSLRVVDRLAQRDRDARVGLNLTFEVRDGIVSHNGEEFTSQKLIPSAPKDLSALKVRHDAGNPCTLEGCIVRLVDKVAYAGRDLEDGLLSGLIKQDDVPRFVNESLGWNNGKIVDTLLKDIIHNSQANQNYVAMSKSIFDVLNQLIQFNYQHIYCRPEVQEYKEQARTSLRLLFYLFMDVLKRTIRFQDMSKLPNGLSSDIVAVFERFVKEIGYTEPDKDAQIVIDFLSGFTDHYVLRVIDELLGPKVLKPHPIV